MIYFLSLLCLVGLYMAHCWSETVIVSSHGWIPVATEFRHSNGQWYICLFEVEGEEKHQYSVLPMAKSGIENFARALVAWGFIVGEWVFSVVRLFLKRYVGH